MYSVESIPVVVHSYMYRIQGLTMQSFRLGMCNLILLLILAVRAASLPHNQSECGSWTDVFVKPEDTQDYMWWQPPLSQPLRLSYTNSTSTTNLEKLSLPSVKDLQLCLRCCVLYCVHYVCKFPSTLHQQPALVWKAHLESVRSLT